MIKLTKMKISIIIPAFNEEKRIGATLEALDIEFSKSDSNQRQWEIIIVDDGSTDETGKVINEYQQKFNYIKCIRHYKNMGKGKAVCTGVMKASGEFIVIYDADAATPPSFINKFVSVMENEDLDIIIGSRELGYRQGFDVSYLSVRRAMGRIYSFFTNLVVKGYLDTQCGFKVFRKEVAHHLFSLLQQKGYVWDIEILMLANYYSYKVKEMPIDWHHKTGSKINIISDSLIMLFHLFQIKVRQYRLKKEQWLRSEACIICGSRYWKIIKQQRPWKILSCYVCGLGTIIPKPASEELNNLYNRNYFKRAHETIGYNDYLLWEKFIKKTANRRLDLIEKHINRRSNLLEVGCATGYFLEVAAKRGWQIKGIEISQWAINYAIKILGENNIINSSIEDAIMVLEDNKYNVIAAWDVIEHLREPHKVIKRFYELLTADGLLAITTPDSSGFLSLITGRNWLNYRKVPEHIYFFNKDSLCQLLEQNGFSIILAQSHGKHTPVGVLINRLFQIIGLNLNFLEKNKFINRLGFYCNPTDIMLVIARARREG